MTAKKTLILGASENPDRYSYRALNSLVRQGHPVVAVGLREGRVAGVDILCAPAPFTDIDTVTLYLNPKNQEPYYDYLLSLHPKRVVFNPGTENPALMSILRENGIIPEVACTLVLLATGQY